MQPLHSIHATAIAVLGTGSDVGKTVITAGLCRILARAGVRVAPFKAQNMALNSFATPEGGEIGRAQALQAEACGIPPHVDMNPILLKPEADGRSQVVVRGRVYGNTDALQYFTGNGMAVLRPVVEDSYRRLAAQYETIVIEGAGSAAELNLRDRDLVNWPVVELADARVVLVGDIDRGGVFAQLIGTLDLLAPRERARVCGLIVNKFRGDLSLFRDGIRLLEDRTGVPVLGVVPFVREPELDQEDSLEVDRSLRSPFAEDRVNVAVLLLPHMSNFTDFNTLAKEPDVALRYAARPEETTGADVVIIPGTKTTVSDLADLKARGFEPRCVEHVREGRELVGICGGYQMLGRLISDPLGVETGGEGHGFGFLKLTTTMRRTKVIGQVIGKSLEMPGLSPQRVRGYYIHMGETDRHGHAPCFELRQSGSDRRSTRILDGAVSDDGLVWGTYLHGVFDEAGFRRAWLNRVRIRKGLPSLDVAGSLAVNRSRQQARDRWADHLERSLNLKPVWEFLGLLRRVHAHHESLHTNG